MASAAWRPVAWHLSHGSLFIEALAWHPLHGARCMARCRPQSMPWDRAMQAPANTTLHAHKLPRTPHALPGIVQTLVKRLPELGSSENDERVACELLHTLGNVIDRTKSDDGGTAGATTCSQVLSSSALPAALARRLDARRSGQDTRAAAAYFLTQLFAAFSPDRLITRDALRSSLDRLVLAPGVPEGVAALMAEAPRLKRGVPGMEGDPLEFATAALVMILAQGGRAVSARAATVPGLVGGVEYALTRIPRPSQGDVQDINTAAVIGMNVGTIVIALCDVGRKALVG